MFDDNIKENIYKSDHTKDNIYTNWRTTGLSSFISGQLNAMLNIDLQHQESMVNLNYSEISNTSKANKILLMDYLEYAKRSNVIFTSEITNTGLESAYKYISNIFFEQKEIDYLEITRNERLWMLSTSTDIETKKEIAKSLGLKDMIPSLNISDNQLVLASRISYFTEQFLKKIKSGEVIYKKNDDIETIIDGLPELHGLVYQRYRGGGIENGRQEIRKFDKGIQHLLRNGVVLLNDKQEIEFKLDGLTREQTIIFKEINRLAKLWNGNNNDSKIIGAEIAAAMERISLHCDLTLSDKYSEYFGNSADKVINNPGMILGLGLILTENTRSYLKKSGILQKNYRSIMNKVHPDHGGDVSKSQRVNSAYDILNNKR